MSGKDIGAISLTNPPAIHVGPIMTPGSNETISIVIPLSAQLATISRKNFVEPAAPPGADSPQQKSAPVKTRKDKVKGCPFPNCSRYGHAFSRAHDLKRHIARHESRKERLADVPQSQLHGCPECAHTFVSEQGLQVHLQTHEDPKDADLHKQNDDAFPCQKPDEGSSNHCGVVFENAEDFQDHLKEHANSILQAQASLQDASLDDELAEDNDEDKFLLEEMLLFKRDSRHLIDRLSGDKKAASIRCNYCFKTFKTKWTLNCHVAAHEGRFQFDCRKCGKKFVRKSHYEGHVRSHEPARPYSCDQCGKSFKELKHRREHTKRKHPNTAQETVHALLSSIGPCVDEKALADDQTKLTILMPMNFNV